MDDEGKRMSLYGKSYQSPGEHAGLWKNVLKRTERIRKNHLATKGDGSAYWPGIQQWSRNELDDLKSSCYGKRTRTTIADVSTTYDRLFLNTSYDYDSKLHRDDRKNVLSIGRAVHDEETKRPVPVLTSSNYGNKLQHQLEPFCRKNVRIEHIVKGFYHKRGTGLPPLDI
ncbi:hypothetical protein KUTeg_019950 [Tegillarca granosa]|uniref:Uncharacterized protein n=1 Tax=Tegillarca granosa TaxID=220873 RepID=A0ABQ9EFZ2_TEGGR|nr:hypothetical protein KUTeg_019950 [Tegillarca granosa]